MSFVGLHLKPCSHTQCYLTLLFSVCIFASVAGCEQAKSPRDTGGEPVATEKVKKPKVDDTRVTLAEANEFAKKYLSAIDRRRARKIVKLVHWDTFVDRIFKGLSTDNAFYEQYSAGAKGILGSFAESIEKETADGGSYALLKTVLRGKDRHAIFRLVSGSSAPNGAGRINYHNLRLIKRDGQVRADDIYVARVGAWLSESYRNSVRPVLLQRQKVAGRSSVEQKKEIRDAVSIAQLVKAIRSGNKSDASKIYQQLPDDVKKAKTVLLTKLLATERDEFLEAVEAMNSQYPDSPAVGLSLIDFGMKQRDLQTLERASEMLVKWTAGDPYVDLNVAFMVSKLGQAGEAAELSREIDPKEFDFANAIYLKYHIALAAKDNAGLVECFRILKKDYGENIDVLLESDACRDFVESLEYLDLKYD